ncbi:hypothetical protein JW949_00425 [Candidatus Woesearchaeota archaeon]|nr:hypothetical protein [Candidatus Woesearchaeota archaeon]
MKENQEIPYLISEGKFWLSVFFSASNLETFLRKKEFELTKEEINVQTELGMDEFCNKYKKFTDKIKELYDKYAKLPRYKRFLKYMKITFLQIGLPEYIAKTNGISTVMVGYTESNRLRASLTGEPIKEGYHNGLIELWALTKENMFLKEKYNKTNTEEYKELKEDFDYYDEMFNDEMGKLEKTIKDYLF